MPDAHYYASAKAKTRYILKPEGLHLKTSAKASSYSTISLEDAKEKAHDKAKQLASRKMKNKIKFAQEVTNSKKVLLPKTIQASHCNLVCKLSQPEQEEQAGQLEQLVASPSAAKPKVPAGYTPAQIKIAYNVPPIVYPTSKKVSIAIIIAYHYNNLQKDFDTFCKQYGLPQYTLNIINLGKPTNVNSGWQLEECLDVQWSYAMNPNANISVIEAKSNTIYDLCNAVQYANNMRTDIVSMSWGCSEFVGQSTFDSFSFSNPSVCYLAATGDLNVPCWPALSPNVIACGGTTLSSISPLTQSTWVSAGCGVSNIYAMPNYQAVPCKTSVTMKQYTKRCIPDISCVANPNLGVSVFYGGQWWVVGGTSVSTPIIAGVLSIAVQTRINNKKVAITSAYTKTQQNLLQNLLYITIYGNSYAQEPNNQTLPPTQAYSANFFDNINGSDGIYVASTGIDMAVGLGSPNWGNLVKSVALM